MDSRSVGMGLLGWLTILFVGLKLTGYIEWSWLWVLAPLWIPGAIILTLLAVVFFAALIAGVKHDKRRRRYR